MLVATTETCWPPTGCEASFSQHQVWEKTCTLISQLAHRLRKKFQWPQEAQRRRKKDQLS